MVLTIPLVVLLPVVTLQAEQAGLFPTRYFYIFRIVVSATIIGGAPRAALPTTMQKAQPERLRLDDLFGDECVLLCEFAVSFVEFGAARLDAADILMEVESVMGSLNHAACNIGAVVCHTLKAGKQVGPDEASSNGGWL